MMGDMSTQRHERRDVPADTFEMRLAMARFHAGNISANEAALRVGVNGQTWRNWEAGTSPGAHQPAMLAFIAQQLGVDQDWLMWGGPLDTPERPNSPETVAGRHTVEEPDCVFPFLRAVA